MSTRPSLRVRYAFLVALLPAFALAQDPGFVPPTAVFFYEDFESATTVPENWQVDAGDWVVANGSYSSRGDTPIARTMITEYLNPLFPDRPERLLGPWTFRARVRIPSGDVRQVAGVVFNYEDETNYLEAVFSPSGTFLVRRLRFGVASTLVEGSYFGGGPNVWFDIEVSSSLTVRINGNLLTRLSPIDSPPFGGRVGLTTHETSARFDKVSVAGPCCANFAPHPFRQDFNSFGHFPPGQVPGNWIGTRGEWSVTDGTLTNTTVRATSSIFNDSVRIAAEPASTLAYTVRARMLNPYGASGNLVGLFFNDSPVGRGEVVFSPTGVARIRLIRNGTVETIATSPYPGRRNVWFDVRADVYLNRITVAVDGVPIFADIPTAEIFEGQGGLVTHWAPGKFDDVWYDNRSIFHPLSETFESAPPPNWTVSGTWNTSGGTLNNTSAGVSDIVTTNCGCWETDFSYRARLLNQYGASGNLVGLVYNYQRLPARRSDPRPYLGLYNGDYYEVVFSPVGQAFMNKVLNGVRYRVATGAHNVPRNVWFNVEVLHQSDDRSSSVFGIPSLSFETTVKVNGVTIFDRVPQGELPYGDVGVVAHWARSRFDNLSVTDAPRRPR